MSEEQHILEIPEADFTPLVTPGTKEDDAIKKAAQQVDDSVSLALDDDTEEGDSENLGDLFMMVCIMGSEYLAERKGEHWRLKEQETEQLHQKFSRYMETAFPDAKLTPGWALIATCGAVALPRVLQDATGGQNAERE